MIFINDFVEASKVLTIFRYYKKNHDESYSGNKYYYYYYNLFILVVEHGYIVCPGT